MIIVSYQSTVDSVAIDFSNCRPPADVQSKKKQDNDERISSAINPVLENPPETHPVRPRGTNAGKFVEAQRF